MAANELAAHCSLQPPAALKEAQHICTLLGGFMPRSGQLAGEQVPLTKNHYGLAAIPYALCHLHHIRSYFLCDM